MTNDTPPHRSEAPARQRDEGRSRDDAGSERSTERVRAWLELDPHAEPVTGSLRAAGAPAATPFTGWLGLAAELEALFEQHAPFRAEPAD